jgi:cysteinyl-tRNA synthetase
MAGLTLFNTLSRSKEPFEPLHPPKVGMYTCGPTVYNFAHIGNLRSYIFADILRRVLHYNRYQVTQVMNITDVGHLTSDADEGEDKMEKGAKREGKSVWEIAAFYTEQFKKDIRALNIEEPDLWCKATDHIKEQIEQVKALEAKGFTYQIEDGIYFDTSKLDDYGKLARLDLENLKAGARVEVAEGKRNPADFALWKFSPKDEKRQMEWNSPWGIGFPGWHIECSAMSSKYLGEQFDIHTGGIDHIPVHHTNEIAQAEAAFGKKPWVKYWLHGEFLVIDKGKMAKSGENFLTLAVVQEKGYEPLDYRYLCLSAHYRQQLKFSWEALDTAKQSRARLMNIIEELRDAPEESGDDEAAERMEQYEQEFLSAINDDLNMPQALAVLWNGLRDTELGKLEKVELLVKSDAALGLGLLEKRQEEVPAEVVALANAREAARAKKDWKESDRLRKQIQDDGYEISDGKEGYKIKKRPG